MMRLKKKKCQTAVALLTVLSLMSALVMAQSPVPVMPPADGPTPTGTGAPAPNGKQKPPVAPVIPAFQQLQKAQFPQLQEEVENAALTKPQVLCKVFIELLANQHFMLADWQKQQDFRNKWLTKIQDVKTLAEADALNIAAKESLGQRFDYYMSPDDKSREVSMSNPTMVGIGIIVRLRNVYELLDSLPDDAKPADAEKLLVISAEHPLVITPYPGSPAAKAGLWDGDIIKEIDGKPINGMKLADVINLIRGSQGTKVKFKVERQDDGSNAAKLLLSAVLGTTPSQFAVPKVSQTGPIIETTIEVERDMFIAPVVHVSQLDDGSTLIKLDNFMAANAAQEMLMALRAVAAKTNGKIILDLRDNGGGRLDHAINIVQFMIAEGTIVRLRERNGLEMLNTYFTATRDALITTQQAPWNPNQIIMPSGPSQRIIGVPETVPIVVLINRYTASASELTSRALQFHKRAKIVGENSMGKGVGQIVVDLPENRRAHITTFYFDPAAQEIDFEGIHPDVVRTLEPEMKQLKALRAKLRTLLKSNAEANADLAKTVAALTKLDTEIKDLERRLAAAKTDQDKESLTKKKDQVVAKQDAAAKQKDELTKQAGESQRQLAGIRKELADLHKMLQNNDPQLQEAKKLIKSESERLAKEEKDKAALRKQWTDRKHKEWEQQRKLHEELRKKQAEQKKKAA